VRVTLEVEGATDSTEAEEVETVLAALTIVAIIFYYVPSFLSKLSRNIINCSWNLDYRTIDEAEI
jgi:hypothetical protein